MLDVKRFRDGMALLGSAVNVVTTDGPAGRAGFTATAVCSVTDTPPTLIVCQNKGSWTHRFFAENGVLCVNLLAADQEGLSGLFASREVTMAERFEQVAWDRMETGSPALAGALVNFDCRIAAIQEVGTHSVFFCDVLDIRRGAASGGLVYFDRGYHHLPQAVRAAS